MPKRIDRAEFLRRAKKVHGNRYTYENVAYIGYKQHVNVTCRIHGDFLVTPKSHCFQQTGCPKCGIKTAIRATGNAYYGLGVDTKYRSGRGSFSVFEKKIRNQPLALTKEFKVVHGDQYTYYFPIPVVNRERDKVSITCPIHGKFQQSVKNHLLGQGCPECGKKKSGISLKVPFIEFLERANHIHNNFFTYVEDSYIQITDKVQIVCPYHGEFTQLAISHVRGTGCPECSKLRQGSSPEMFKGIPTIFYVLRLVDSVYKIGITTKSTIEERYCRKIDKDAIDKILFLYTFFDGSEARTFELDLIKKLKPFGFRGDSVMSIKTTEMFIIDPTSIIQQLLTS